MTKKTDQQTPRKNILVVILTFVSSSASLMCCALPTIFVMLGFGAAFTSLINTLPWIVKISEYKWWTFALAGMLIALSAWQLNYSKKIACSYDPEKAKSCSRLRKFSLGLFIVSITMFLIGNSFVVLGIIIT